MYILLIVISPREDNEEDKDQDKHKEEDKEDVGKDEDDDKEKKGKHCKNVESKELQLQCCQIADNPTILCSGGPEVVAHILERSPFRHGETILCTCHLNSACVSFLFKHLTYMYNKNAGTTIF